MQDVLEKILGIAMEHKVAVLVGVIGIICLLSGVVSLASQKKESDSLEFASAPKTSSVKSEISVKPEKELMVDVEGAVVKPGVYRLKSDSRIRDALFAAGGLAENADREKTAQNLNLAAPLTDGAKLYIPAIGEQMVTSGGDSSGSSNGTSTVTAQININQASASELDTLSGVGEVTAQKIITNRPYKAIEDLTAKKVVGASVFEKIKDRITVY
jgi:competence protein ComEA